MLSLALTHSTKRLVSNSTLFNAVTATNIVQPHTGNLSIVDAILGVSLERPTFKSLSRTLLKST